MLVWKTGMQSVFQFFPVVFSGVEVSDLCRPSVSLVHTCIVMLKQVLSFSEIILTATES